MQKLFIAIALRLASLLPITAFGFDCPVTIIPTGNQVPPLESTGPWGWFGSKELAVFMPKNGKWKGMGPERNYANKFWWWREGYDARKESKPKLVITANRLDEHSEIVTFDDATSGYNASWNAMLMGMTFPSAGCWEVVGSYDGSYLQVVLQVGDASDH